MTTTTLRYAWHDTILGPMLAVAGPHGLCALRFCAAAGKQHILREVREQFPKNELVEDAAPLGPLLKKLEKLKQLDLTDTLVTEGAVKTLQRSLPKCRIEH